MPLGGRRGTGLRDSVWWLVLAGLLAEKFSGSEQRRAGEGVMKASDPVG